MAAESAADAVARGYTAVKFDPAGPYTLRGGHMPAMSDISQSVAFCKAIREAVGDKADLLFGTHGQFNTAGAIRLGQALEPYSPLWFEEPTPPPPNTTSVSEPPSSHPSASGIMCAQCRIMTSSALTPESACTYRQLAAATTPGRPLQCCPSTALAPP